MSSPILIPLSRLEPHPDNPRIADSEEVVLQIENQIRFLQGWFDPAHAIKVRPHNGGYQIVSGHNRVKAAGRAQLTEIPAWVREMSDEEAFMLLITDNAQRELRPLERGMHAVKAIQKGNHNGLSIKKYAERAGRELKAVEYETWAAEVVLDEKRSRDRFSSKFFGFTRQLATIHAAPPKHWPALVEKLLAEEWTVKQTQAEVRKLIERQKPAHPAVTLEAWKKLSARRQAEMLDWRACDYHSQLNRQKDTSIDWAQHSWNPVTGCLHNCVYCYARDIAEELYQEKFQPTLRVDRLVAPYQTAVPALASGDVAYRNIFTCSMADLFGRWVPKEWIEAVLEVVRENPQWNFLFLTKFPLRMAEFEYPDNAWLGTTVDLQARVPNAEKAMRNVKAKVKWLSLEPLLEPLRFEDLSAFQWIVIGGASPSTQTPEWRPPRAWVWNLTMQARAAGCLVYHKTNLAERLKEFPGRPEREPAEAPEVFHYLTKEHAHDDLIRISIPPRRGEKS